MIAGEEIARAIADAGIGFYTGVPCSYLSPLMNAAILSGTPYQPAASEGEALGIAAGAWLAGTMPAVLAQNSGLGNMVNPLTSLNHTFTIPALLLITWRGHPGTPDEPQHEQMGTIMHRLLDTLDIPHEPLAENAGDLAAQMQRVVPSPEDRHRPRAIIVPPGLVTGPKTVPPLELEMAGNVVESRSSGSAELSREMALKTLLALVTDETAIVATTGKTGRELFTLDDRPGNFYMVGSMGCAAGIGLGVARHVDNPVVVVDGDGALLMKMGALATMGAAKPTNLVHLLLDNGVHDSTGGQPTVSPGVDWCRVASACGYRAVYRAITDSELAAALKEAREIAGPVFVHVPTLPGSMENLGRPTVTPRDVAQRFRTFLEPYRSGNDTP